MTTQFLTYLRQTCGVAPNETVLLACSGGVDSMVLANLLLALNQPFAVAHCNFQLRGEASDQDEAFVYAWCRARAIPFFVKRFDVGAEKQAYGISTQMAARNLRYAWFSEIMQCNPITYLATAHHMNDSLETVLGNLTRGTGPKGLRGILPRNASIIRPLLFVTKEAIVEFAKHEKWEWREDQSNATDNYKRNRIRHQIVPLLEQENKNLWASLEETLERQQQLVAFAESQVSAVLHAHGWPSNALDTKHIVHAPEVFLTHMLGIYGFGYRTIKQITATLSSAESKDFWGETHRLNISRGRLTLLQNHPNEQTTYVVNSIQELNELPFVQSAVIEKREEMTALGMKGRESFCLRHITWPLVFRRWQSGDKMKPIGMLGNKLVSDILTDDKVSALEKENTLVMISEENILWVLNSRISEISKVTSKSKHILSITLKIGD